MTRTLKPSDVVPEEWNLQLVRLFVAVAVFSLVGAFFVVQAVVALTAGRRLEAALLALFAVTTIAIVLAGCVFAWHRRWGLSSGVSIANPGGEGSATILRMSRGVWLVFVFLPAYTASFVWYGVLKLEDRVPWTEPTLIRPPSRGVVLLVVSLVGAVLCLEYLRGGFRTLRISLSPAGIVYRATTAETILPWDAVSAVTASNRPQGNITVPTIDIAYATRTPGVRRRQSSWLSRGAGEAGPSVIDKQAVLQIRPEGFEIGAPRLLATLQFYYEHPQNRAELGTDTSLQRIVTGSWVHHI